MSRISHSQAVKLLPNHRAHDAQHLIQRWRVLARTAGCRVKILCKVGDMPVIVLESASAQSGEPAVYLSTGVHGDEAGSAWGLLTWAEKHVNKLKRGSFLIAPCLNPVGLTLNTRADHRGLDINRRFHDAADEICGPWQQWITGRAMRFGLCLHEDYDGQGIYLYELNHARQTVGHEIIERCARVIAPDPRKNIDGHPTTSVCSTSAAGSVLPSPAWLARTTTSPAPVTVGNPRATAPDPRTTE